MKRYAVIKNSLITAGILGAATGFCFLIQEAAESDTHVPPYFYVKIPLSFWRKKKVRPHPGPDSFHKEFSHLF